MPAVRVEFYGVPRLRAGIDSVVVEADSVAELFSALQTMAPEFAEACLPDGQLAKEYLLNINGTSFTRDSATQLKDSDVVLILSADVGG